MALRVPGVIVDIVNQAGAIATPTYVRYPVIIGVGDSNLSITTRIQHGSTDNDVIPVTTEFQEFTSVTTINHEDYTASYTYDSQTVSIFWETQSGTYPKENDRYVVSFTETVSASAYTPTLIFDQNTLYSEFGGTTRTDGSLNELVAGAWLSLQAGAPGVIVLQLDLRDAIDPLYPTNAELEQAFNDAVTKLEEITDYKLFLVPLSSGTLDSTTAADIMFNHAIQASLPENKQERTVVAALPKGTSVVDIATYAQGYANERMVVPATKNTSTKINVSGFATNTYDTRFYNCAMIGVQCSVGVGINISDGIVPNITLDSNFTPNELNYLVQRGISPAKSKNGVVRNVLAITTDTTGALTEDLGVQDVKDYVKRTWREGLWADYRNAPITNSLPGEVANTCKSMLDSMLRDSIIADYTTPLVQQDQTEPRKLNIRGRIKPAFGVQWMDVEFVFVTTMSA